MNGESALLGTIMEIRELSHRIFLSALSRRAVRLLFKVLLFIMDSVVLVERKAMIGFVDLLLVLTIAKDFSALCVCGVFDLEEGKAAMLDGVFSCNGCIYICFVEPAS